MLSSCNFSVASRVSTSQKVWRDFRNFLCLALLFVYLAVLPGGMLGFVVMTVCLMTKLTLMPNVKTFGLYLLLFGMKTMGMVTLAFGYPGVGGKIAFVIGIAIFIFFTDFHKTLKRIQAPLLYLVWIGVVLFLSYLNGPQTDYCTNKLSTIITYGLILIIPFFYLMKSRSVDWCYLGQLGVLSALVCLSACILLSPSVRPDSILDVGAMRLASLVDEDILEIRNLVAGLALLGFVLYYAATPDRFISRLSLAHLCVYLFTALLVISWSGSRLPLVSAGFVVVTILLVKPLYKKRYKKIIVLFIGVSILVMVYGFSQQLQFFMSVADSSRSYASRVNRDTNWEAACRRVIEKPVFGHGLGGYYIEGYSYPGGGTYAHNLALELLSETGVVGTVLILAPILIWRKAISFSFLIRAKNGGAVFPLILLLFLQSMVSYNLSENIGLFSMIGAIAVSKRSFKKT
jgi:O-antigen ligase